MLMMLGAIMKIADVSV